MVVVVAQGDMGKPRPAVVVQADELGDVTTSVLVCPMSSDVSEAHHLRPVVPPTARNGLRLPSQIMTDKINSLRRDRVRRVLGSLDEGTIEKLDGALLVVLGLARSPRPPEGTLLSPGG
ncbi:MAG: type II toxin-antitoxin system PemK/MazF family toxin [Bradyrhizobium sp.]